MTRAGALWVAWLGLAGCFPAFPTMGDLHADPNDDADGDGWVEGAGVCGETDCDDTKPGVNPDAYDALGDGVDRDCDCACEFDLDGDEHAAVGAPMPAPETWTCLAYDDCDDGDPSVFPGASEELGREGVDDDCDGQIDEGTDLDLPRSASLVVHGKEAGAWVADTLALDAFGDLIVGAKHGTPVTGENEAGVVYVVDRETLRAAVVEAHDMPVYLEDLGEYRYDGLSKNDHAGTALAALRGDLAAVVIGAPDRDPGAAVGAGTVYYDRAVPEGDLVQALGSSDTIVQGVDDGDNLGDELVVGDFDGDGLSDLALAAPRRGADSGAVYLLFDPDQLGIFAVDDLATGFVDGAVAMGLPGGEYGEGLSVLDADVDGYDDLVVASPNANLVHLWLGAEGGPAFGGPPDAEWLGPKIANAATGLTMASLDWDGDAKPELAITARGADGTTDGATNDGELYLVSGTQGGPLTDDPVRVSTCRFLGVAGEGEFGHGVARLGDLDGDGADELLVAARSASIVYLVLGGGPCTDALIDDAATWRWKYDEGAAYDDDSYAGHTLLALGDLDGGGKDDFVVGHYRADVPVVTLPELTGGADAGAFYVLLGEDLVP